MKLILRDNALALIIRSKSLDEAFKQIAELRYFLAPNPEEKDGKNIMGQTEDEFWRLVDNDSGFNNK